MNKESAGIIAGTQQMCDDFMGKNVLPFKTKPTITDEKLREVCCQIADIAVDGEYAFYPQHVGEKAITILRSLLTEAGVK
jgi:hypothetical protein